MKDPLDEQGVVNANITLDGVMQAPSDHDEDRRGGFEHGGWASPHFDQVMADAAAEGIAKGGALLFGRRTYEQFASFWSTQSEDNPFTTVLNERQKYVASTKLEEPLPWKNSTILVGDAAEAVAKLKEQPGDDLVVLGSGELVRSLMQHDLVDEYVLLIDSLVLGSRRRLFTDGGPSASLRLVDTKTTTTGVVIATYEPSEPTKG
ncbi:MAG: dihydrofolate reductase family protein [Actinomycetota bacterium]|nr:dihydrofolate reductase family protein [Actinomycetota bacterium]